MDEGRAMDVVCLYFSQAFKSISHSTLLEKPAAHGLDECTVLRVKNHLDSWAHRVLVNGVTFSWWPVTHGFHKGKRQKSGRMPLVISYHKSNVTERQGDNFQVAVHWSLAKVVLCSNTWLLRVVKDEAQYVSSWTSRPGFAFLKSPLKVLHTLVGSLKNVHSGPAPISRFHILFFLPGYYSILESHPNTEDGEYLQGINTAQKCTNWSNLNLPNPIHLEPLWKPRALTPV